MYTCKKLPTCSIQYPFLMSSDTYKLCTEPNLLPSLAENFYTCFVGLIFCQVGELNQLKAEKDEAEVKASFSLLAALMCNFTLN